MFFFLIGTALLWAIVFNVTMHFNTPEPRMSVRDVVVSSTQTTLILSVISLVMGLINSVF